MQRWGDWQVQQGLLCKRKAHEHTGIGTWTCEQPAAISCRGRETYLEHTTAPDSLMGGASNNFHKNSNDVCVEFATLYFFVVLWCYSHFIFLAESSCEPFQLWNKWTVVQLCSAALGHLRCWHRQQREAQQLLQSVARASQPGDWANYNRLQVRPPLCHSVPHNVRYNHVHYNNCVHACLYMTTMYVWVHPFEVEYA